MKMHNNIKIVSIAQADSFDIGIFIWTISIHLFLLSQRAFQNKIIFKSSLRNRLASPWIKENQTLNAAPSQNSYRKYFGHTKEWRMFKSGAVTLPSI